MRYRRIAYLAIAMLLTIATGCQRIPLYERSTKVNLVLDLKRGLDHDIVLSYETLLSKEYQDKIDEHKEEWHEVNWSTEDWADHYGCDPEDVEDAMDDDMKDW